MSRRARSGAALGAVLLATPLGCSSAGYLIHLAKGQGKILLGRVDLDDELARDDLPPARRARLELVLAAKAHAVDAIGLEPGGYTTLFDTEGGPAAWNVSACRDDAFQPFVWVFPITGAIPYKGFFDKKLAVEEARALKAERHDVFVYGAKAYSTLGWFEDPLYTSMLDMADHDLCATVIHEMTHATVFVPGDAEFNETLAQFVGMQGAIDLFRKLDGPASARAKEAEDDLHDDRVFAEAIAALKKRLAAVYEKGTREEKLAGKRRELDDFPRRYKEEVRPRLRAGTYDGLVARKSLDNAQVLLLERYHGDLDVFAAFHEKHGRDLAATVRALAALAREPEPRAALARAARGP